MPPKLPEDIKIYSSIEEFNENLPETVELLKTKHGSNVYLIGTAHFSLKSQDDVSLVIRNVRPEIVMLELCPMRLHILYFDEERLLKEASELNTRKMLQIFQQHGLTGGLFYLKFLRVNANITQQLGIAPGGEARRAVAEAMLIEDCQVFLGDRLIYITMQRAIRSLGPMDRLGLFFFLLTNRTNKKITMEDVEELKKRSTPSASEPPDANAQKSGIYRSFITERDLLLCHSLQYAAIKKRDDAGNPVPVNVVGVVGIGHSPGIVRNWGRVTSDQIKDLMIIPPEKLANRIITKGVRIGLIALCGYGLYRTFYGERKQED